MQSNSKNYVFIPFGRTGIGKSSFLNMLSNSNYFKTSPLAKACTKNVSAYTYNVNSDKTMTVVDNPGLYEDNGEEDQINMKKLADFLRKSEYGFNGIGIFISVSDCRLYPVTKKAIKLLYQFIGNNDLWSHVCVIVTHCPPYQEDLEKLKNSMTSGNNSLKSRIITLIKGISHIQYDPQIPFFFVDSLHPNYSPSLETLPLFKEWLFKLSSFRTNNLNEPDVKCQYKKTMTKIETSPRNMIPIYTYEPGPIPEYKELQINPMYRYIDNPLIFAIRVAIKKTNEENKRKAMESRKMEKVLKGYYQEITTITKSWLACWDYNVDIIDENHPSYEINHEIKYNTTINYFNDKMSKLSIYNNYNEINELKSLI